MLIQLLLLVCFLMIVIWKLKSPSKTSKLPPGPRGWSLVGNIFSVGKKPHVLLSNLARTHGELLSFSLGQRLVIVASSAAAATEILKTQDSSLHGKFVTSVISNIPEILESTVIFALNKETWNFLRSISHNQLFSTKSIQSQTKLREEKANAMVEYLRGRENTEVTVKNLLFATVVNIFGNLLVSRDLVEFADEVENGKMKKYTDSLTALVASTGLGDLHAKLGRIDVWSKKKAMNTFGMMKFLWEDFIKERRDHIRLNGGATTAKDLLDVLIGNSFNDDKIVNMLMELLGAGVDTSVITTEWLLAELVKNEESMEKLREEIKVAIKDCDSLNESNLSNLPYLQACIKETLRLHHPAPIVTPHCALETCTVMNYTIPKDSLVVVNLWAIARDPSLWDDPLKFKPERFLDSDRDFRGSHGDFMPFSAGRRMCPGLPMAVKQISIIVASLVHYFDWVLPNGMEPSELSLDEKFGIVLHMENPLVLIPKARKM